MDWLRRLFGWTRRRQDALAEELDAHRALVEDELRRAGLSPADAALEARRRLGNVTLAAEDAREAWTFRWLDQLRQYTRHGARGLRREPLFAVTTILTLGLGMAATATVFSIVDAEMWRPLPYLDPKGLVEVRSCPSTSRTDVDGISLDELAEWRRAPGLASLAATSGRRRGTLQLARAESLVIDDVTANYFTTLGRTALVGRVFTDDDARGAGNAVLTERGWTRMFDRDRSVVGRVVMLDGQPTTIVGIVADDDAMGPEPQMFLAIDERPAAAGSASRRMFGAFGRLAGRASADAVRAQIQAVVSRRTTTDADRREHVAIVEDLSGYYTPLDQGKLYFFLVASALVLLLTVVNTAALVLSRTLRRAPEFSLRGALGGGTAAIAMQLVVEAGLIVLPGSLLGLWATTEAVRFVGSIVPEDFLMRGNHIPVDLRALLFCGGIALATVAGLAVVPLGLARRVGTAAIGAGGRTSARPAAGRTRTILLTAQLAVTVILLAGAGIFLESFVALLHVPMGFDPTSAWSARIALSGPRYADPVRRLAYADAILERARAIPGVRSAAIATSSPLMSGWIVLASDPRRTASPTGDGGLRTIYRAIDGDYFGAVGTPIVRGRAIAPTDVAGAPAVAVVNEQLAQTLFPGEEPVGKTISLNAQHGAPVVGGTVTIVGVAANIKEVSLNEMAFADIYVPFAQRSATTIELLVRGSGEVSLAGALRAAAAAVDASIPVTGTATLAERVAGSTRGARFNLMLVAGFAVVAVLVAGIGIYGAMAYAATARWREYGVRLALGATPRALIGRALWQAARLGITGGLIGVAGALLFAIWLGDALYLVPQQHSGLLFQVKTTDPLSLTGALVGVIALALLAGAIPARRVSRIDPVSALRAE